MVAKRSQVTKMRTEPSLDAFLASALRHPVRIAILRAIHAQAGGLSYRDLSERLAPVTAETVARHLRILRRIGAIVPHVGENVYRVTYLLAESPYTYTLRSMLDASLNRTNEYLWPEMDLLRKLLAAIPEAIVLVSENGQFMLVNDVAEKLWGRETPNNIRAEEYAATFTFYTLDGELLALKDMPIPRALAGDTIIGQEVIYERPDGTHIDLLYNAAPIYTSIPQGRQIIAAVCTFQDISELKALERQRDEFLSIAAHELRTPLTSILGTAQVLLRQLRRVTEEKPLDLTSMKRGLERVNDQSQRINKLVSDLLDTSRIQAGQLEFSMQSADMAAIVRETVDGQSLAHPGRQIRLTAPEGPVLVMGDDVRLAQVLDNLLTNALKYSMEDAPVDVTLALSDKQVYITVRDYGDGIPLEAIPHLFERYYRVPGMEVKSESGVGLGLGLYITSTIVARHHGRIEVTAERGHGTTFHVYIPLLVPGGRPPSP
jgi:two-component system, OmpR family, phosphate regulon sensor histidine kinase PhoR